MSIFEARLLWRIIAHVTHSGRKIISSMYLYLNIKRYVTRSKLYFGPFDKVRYSNYIHAWSAQSWKLRARERQTQMLCELWASIDTHQLTLSYLQHRTTSLKSIGLLFIHIFYNDTLIAECYTRIWHNTVAKSKWCMVCATNIALIYTRELSLYI